jgi:hypothetical protein
MEASSTADPQRPQGVERLRRCTSNGSVWGLANLWFHVLGTQPPKGALFDKIIAAACRQATSSIS